MDRGTIKEVVRDVFGRSTEMLDTGDWVSMKCPLAPWTHESGHDSRPSAGVSVVDDGTSIFNCFTCGNTAPFHVMLKRYSEYTGEDLDELIDELEEGEFLGPRSISSMDAWMQEHMTEVLMPINEGIYMDLYDSAAGHPYLRERGISNRTAKKLELLFDPSDPVDGAPRILFPVRGPDGLLYGFSGRDTGGSAKLKVRDYHGLAKSHCVLGSHLVGPSDDVIVVEGLVDYAVIHDMGDCGCAVMHSTMTKFQAEIIAGLGAPTYLFYDNDQAGRKAIPVAANQLCQHVSVFKPTYPEVWIDDDSEEGGHWLKDPGEMTDAEFWAMKKKARLWDKPFHLKKRR